MAGVKVEASEPRGWGDRVSERKRTVKMVVMGVPFDYSSEELVEASGAELIRAPRQEENQLEARRPSPPALYSPMTIPQTSQKKSG